MLLGASVRHRALVVQDHHRREIYIRTHGSRRVRASNGLS